METEYSLVCLCFVLETITQSARNWRHCSYGVQDMNITCWLIRLQTKFQIIRAGGGKKQMICEKTMIILEINSYKLKGWSTCPSDRN